MGHPPQHVAFMFVCPSIKCKMSVNFTLVCWSPPNVCQFYTSMLVPPKCLAILHWCVGPPPQGSNVHQSSIRYLFPLLSRHIGESAPPTSHGRDFLFPFYFLSSTNMGLAGYHQNAVNLYCGRGVLREPSP